ncbi:hypothetical protein H2248_011986 [Termitomyces sp. 'cryptogamus']|nr:hypothetical protein H2248_011986 [Termitomyces sp. 'cryptogamus']
MSSPSSPSAPSADTINENASSVRSSSPPKMISPPPAKYKTRTPSQSTASSAHIRPLSDIIGEKFPPFDHETNIVQPFNNELSRDAEFEKGTRLED